MLTGATQKTMQNNNNEQGNAQAFIILNLPIMLFFIKMHLIPFGDGTTIKYFIPDNMDAQIVFYDNYGNQIKIFKVAENGMGQLNVSCNKSCCRRLFIFAYCEWKSSRYKENAKTIAY